MSDYLICLHIVAHVIAYIDVLYWYKVCITLCVSFVYEQTHTQITVKECRRIEWVQEVGLGL